MLTRTLIYLLIFFSLLSSCGKPSSVKEAKQQTEILTSAAKQLEKQGYYLKAAQKYLEIAAQSIPPTQQHYQLSAIKAFLKGNMLTDAKTELAKLDASQSYGLEIPLKFIHTHIDLAEQRADQAFQRLKGIDTSTLSKPLNLEYKQLYAQALAGTGKVLQAVREWVTLDKLSNFAPETKVKNYQKLWHSLSTQNLSRLKQVKQIPGDTFSGWIALALFAKTSHQQNWQQNLENWQRRFPNHPAIQDIVPKVEQQVNQILPPPQQIALLLPSITSRFGKYAEAIKNGFFAAAQVDDKKKRHKISLYEVDENNILELYQQVIEDGATFVVGPLLKDSIATLADYYAQLPVPTLSLNHLGIPATTTNLYQLGLSPEDEAKEVAKRAWTDGHRSALVLVPDGSWGEGILKAFLAEWKDRGGRVVKKYLYGENFETTIPNVLQRVRIKRTNMVFMVALPQHVLQLQAFLEFFFKGRLPTYSISRVYDGTPNPNRDNYLDGIMFVDMPWVLVPDEEATQLQTTLQKSWPEELKKYKRLYALGIDAYSSIDQIQQLNQLQWQGQTGRLSINDKGIIHRDQLRWARFVKGLPHLLE